MSTYFSDYSVEWNVLSGDPDGRVNAAREYALSVFESAAEAAAWFARPNPMVLEGRCSVAEACRKSDGFVEAIRELIRLGTAPKGTRPRRI